MHTYIHTYMHAYMHTYRRTFKHANIPANVRTSQLPGNLCEPKRAHVCSNTHMRARDGAGEEDLISATNGIRDIAWEEGRKESRK